MNRRGILIAVAITCTAGLPASESNSLPAGPVSQTKIVAPALPKTNAAQWNLEPKRDPFVSTTQKQPTNAAPLQLKLQATWLQADARLAVINGAIVKEGQMFGSFRIKEIKPDAVLIVMSDGASQLLNFEVK